MIVTLASFSVALAAPTACRDALLSGARSLATAPPTSRRLPALPKTDPDQRVGCGQRCRPSGGWKVVPVVPSIVVATSQLDGPSYRAQRAIDGDPATAWVEGARGPGRSEGLIFVFDEPVSIDRIEIIPGSAKSVPLFLANHRLRQSWLSFHPWPDDLLVPSPAPPRYALADGIAPTCAVSIDEPEVVVLTGEPTKPEALRWDLSPYWCRHPGEGRIRHVILRIGAVYEGTRYDDTAISEVRFARLEPILGSSGWVCN